MAERFIIVHIISLYFVTRRMYNNILYINNLIDVSQTDFDKEEMYEVKIFYERNASDCSILSRKR